MLIKANSRKNLTGRAKYLLHNKQNDRAEILDMQGIVFDDDPFLAYAEMSTVEGKHKNPFLSASINPSPIGQEDRRMTREQWLRSVEILEKSLGLDGQPRIVVLHEKEGRQHIHVDWRREKDGKLISDSHMRHICVQAKKQMELEFGHTRTKDYDLHSIREAQGRMARDHHMTESADDITSSRQYRADKAADMFAKDRPAPTAQEEAYRRMMADQLKRDQERGNDRER